MRIAIRAIEYYLPERIETNETLAVEFPEWSMQKLQTKMGVLKRHIAAPHECSSDLGYRAAMQLFDSRVCSPGQIDYLLFCTQSPDYVLPTTAFLLQDRLGIPETAGALDFNLGCSGFVYGLSLAQGLIGTGQASRVLFITAETYSKFIHPKDRSVRSIFGDGAAATLVESLSGGENILPAPFVFGTSGKGAPNLIVPAGGFRTPSTPESAQATSDENGNWRSQNNLFMNGAEIFSFTLHAIPECVSRLLAQTDQRIEDIDFFVFHQASRYMLEHLRKKLGIPEDKFCLCLSSCGNTVSSTIPIALKHASLDGRLKDGQIVMLVGFGVGYSWGATLLRWPLLGNAGLSGSGSV